MGNVPWRPIFAAVPGPRPVGSAACAALTEELMYFVTRFSANTLLRFALSLARQHEDFS
jgi:hypothetical protein